MVSFHDAWWVRMSIITQDNNIYVINLQIYPQIHRLLNLCLVRFMDGKESSIIAVMLVAQHGLLVFSIALEKINHLSANICFCSL